jgi:hypothetical protein
MRQQIYIFLVHFIIMQGCRFFIDVILTSDLKLAAAFDIRSYLKLNVDLRRDSQRLNSYSMFSGCATGEYQYFILWRWNGSPACYAGFLTLVLHLSAATPFLLQSLFLPIIVWMPC